MSWTIDEGNSTTQPHLNGGKGRLCFTRQEGKLVLCIGYAYSGIPLKWLKRLRRAHLAWEKKERLRKIDECVKIKDCLALVACLEELCDLMEGVREGAYKPDSFTTQPARGALKRFAALDCSKALRG